MNIKIAIALIAICACDVFASSQSFDFKDPKGVNNAVFKLDAPLEAINGTANGIYGTIVFDPANPDAISGRIVIDAKSLTVPNPMMNGHMHGAQWLDVNKHPEIVFEATKTGKVQRNGDTITAEITGKMTIHGVTREVTVPVKFTYLKDKLSARVPNLKGDLLVVRTKFTILRSDYGINPGAPAEKVSDEIELSLSLAGAAPTKQNG